MPKSDITAADGLRLTAEAMTWQGTPYALVGAGSIKLTGGDCSGSTWRIYTVAGFPYDYQMTANFPAYVVRTGRFRELKPKETWQDGDILYWPNHMALYATFTNDPADAFTARVNAQGHKWKQKNDMWTASHPGGVPYGPAELRYWRPDAPRVFRYVK
jgi:hypothetical protein